MSADPVIARLFKLVAKAGLADVEQSTSYGTPALKVAGKMLLRIKDDDTLVFRCSLDDKELLTAAAPTIYFETDHYKGWPAVLVRLSKASDKDLTASLVRAWRLMAPKRLLASAKTATQNLMRRGVQSAAFVPIFPAGLRRIRHGTGRSARLDVV